MNFVSTSSYASLHHFFSFEITHLCETTCRRHFLHRKSIFRWRYTHDYKYIEDRRNTQLEIGMVFFTVLAFYFAKRKERGREREEKEHGINTSSVDTYLFLALHPECRKQECSIPMMMIDLFHHFNSIPS